MLTNYEVTGNLDPARDATFSVKKSRVVFGALQNQEDLPNPAELLLGSFAACCLKNIHRFSELLGFDYTNATIEVSGKRQEKPTQIVAVKYVIYLKSSDPRLNPELLHKNLQKFGTIYNTLKNCCKVSGELIVS